jgi:signal peptidase I
MRPLDACQGSCDTIAMDAYPQKSIVLEILKYTILALIIVTPVRLFVAQPFIVSGASMEPTFNPRDYLVIDQLYYSFNEPARGDIMIFKYPQDPHIFLVKRVIALPGETVRFVGGAATITTVEGEVLTLREPYQSGSMRGTRDEETVLHEGEYFVMGDNRSASSDSRVWGPLDKKFIIGRVYARLYPFDKIEYLPGEYRY